MKAVIPAAGLGTRFLPATKTIPKEMLPIVDEPIILHVVREAVKAGIEDIVLITGQGKSAIEDFFDNSAKLEDHLCKTGKEDVAKQLQEISNMANIISLRQQEAKGLGHAVWTAKPVVGNEAFAVMLGDEITLNGPEEASVIGQLAELYNDTGISHVNVIEVPENETHKYGIIAYDQEFTTGSIETFNITNVLEKPAAGSAPSRLALPGRYVFASGIMELLESTKPGKNGEIQLTDAMTEMAKVSGMRAAKVPTRRFDAGDRLGYLQANIEFALMRKDLREDLKSHLYQLLESY